MKDLVLTTRVEKLEDRVYKLEKKVKRALRLAEGNEADIALLFIDYDIMDDLVERLLNEVFYMDTADDVKEQPEKDRVDQEDSKQEPAVYARFADLPMLYAGDVLIVEEYGYTLHRGPADRILG